MAQNATKKVKIWQVDIDDRQYDDYVAHIEFLSSDEMEKYTLYKDKKSKLIYLISHVVLRLVLGKELKTSPRDLRFQISNYGKPSLKGFNFTRFNLSHSEKKAFIIISDTEVGIDVECVKNINYHDIISAFFSQKESLQITKLTNKGEKLIEFFKIWTQKEALLKCLGTGLADDVRNTNLDRVNSTRREKNKINLETILCKDQQYVLSFAYQGVKKKFMIKKFNLKKNF